MGAEPQLVADPDAVKHRHEPKLVPEAPDVSAADRARHSIYGAHHGPLPPIAHPALALPANAPLRAEATRRAQQRMGNRAAQHVLTHTSPPVPAKKSKSEDKETPEASRAPEEKQERLPGKPHPHGASAKPGKVAGTGVHVVERTGAEAAAHGAPVTEPGEMDERQLPDSEAISLLRSNWAAIAMDIPLADPLVISFEPPHAIELQLTPLSAGAQKGKPQADQNQTVRDAVAEYAGFTRAAGAEHVQTLERSNEIRRELVSRAHDAMQQVNQQLGSALDGAITSLTTNRSMIDAAVRSALQALEQGEMAARRHLGGASAGAHKQIGAAAAKTGEAIKRIEADLRHNFETLYADDAKAIEDAGQAAVKNLSSPETHSKVQQTIEERTDPEGAAEIEAERASVPRYLTDLAQGIKATYEPQVKFLYERIAAKPQKGDSLEEVIKKFVESIRKAAIGDGSGGTAAKNAPAPPKEAGTASGAADAKGGAIAKDTSEPLYTQANHAVDHAYAQAMGSLRSQMAAARKSIEAARTGAQQQCSAQRSAIFAQLTSVRQAHVANIQHATANALKTVEDGTRSALPLYTDSCRRVAKSLQDTARKGPNDLAHMLKEGVPGARQSMAAGRITQIKRLEQVGTDAAVLLMQQGTQAGEAASGMAAGFDAVLTTIAQSVTTEMSGTAERQVQGFGGLSAGIAAAAAQFTKPLEKLFEKSIEDARKKTFNPIYEGEKNAFDAMAKEATDNFKGKVDKPREAIQDRLNNVAKTINDSLDQRAKQAKGAWGIVFLSEDQLMSAFRGVTAKQGAAIEYKFEYRQQAGNLRFRLKWEYDDWPGGLNADEYHACISYLNGDTTQGALYELKTAKGWFSSDASKAEQVLRSLTPKEREQVVHSPEWESISHDVRGGLSGDDLNVFDALSKSDVARADAIRLRENVRKAKEQNDKDALFKALENYHPGGDSELLATVRADVQANQEAAQAMQNQAGGMPAPAGERKPAIGKTDEVTFAQVQNKFADIEREAALARGVIVEQKKPAEVLADYVLKPVEVQVPTGDGPPMTVTYTVEGPDAVLARTLAMEGPDTINSKAARLYRESEKKGEKPDFEPLENAVIDPRLNKSLPQGRNLSEDQRKQVRQEQDQMYLAYVNFLKENKVITKDITDPAEARKLAAEHLKSHFDEKDEKGQAGADYVASLVTQDVPDAASALRYAQLGAGTDEALIHRTFQRMSRADVKAACEKYQDKYHSDLFADLGLYGKGTFGELSGDDRLQAEREAMGVPQNDRESAEVALFTNLQQKNETGTVGKLLNSGSGEEAALEQNEKRLRQMAGGKIEFDEFGRPIIPASSKNFDEKGNYKGGDFREFDREVATAKIVAENYAASIDRIANAITIAITVIAAVVATVVTGGAGAPLLAAAIAGAGGLLAMGANYALKGGRYGWEQALTDLGMTAIQALTAGVGASLGAAEKGAQVAAEVGEAVEVAEVAGKTAATVATKAAPSLTQMAKVGAVTGFIGGAGGAALDENTWEHGIGSGFGHIFMGGARGAFGGALGATLTGGLQRLPVGSTGLGGSLARGVFASAGGMAGRAGEIGFDAATGSYRGTLHDALSSIGEAGAQPLLQGFLEGMGETAFPHPHGQATRQEQETAAAKAQHQEAGPAAPHAPAENPPHAATPEIEASTVHLAPERTAGQPEPPGQPRIPALSSGEPALAPGEAIPAAGGPGKLPPAGGAPPLGGGVPPSGEEPLLPRLTDAEIDKAFESATTGPLVQVSGPPPAMDQSMELRLPAAQSGTYWGVDPATGMTVQEYRFLSERGVPAVDATGKPVARPRGDRMTRMRIHSEDPTAPLGSASREGWTLNITQGEHLRMTAEGAWFDKRYGTMPNGSQLDVRPYRRGPAGEWVEAATGRPVTDENHLAALNDWDRKMASSHIPLFPEGAGRPPAPPAPPAPAPETPPPAPHPGTPAEPVEAVPEATRAVPVSDQAAAGIANSRFTGDAAEKFGLPRAESPEAAVRKLTEGGVSARYANIVEENGERSHVELKTQSVDENGHPVKVNVRFEMVDSLPRENGVMPVAMYEQSGPDYVVRISKGAPAASLERAIAHELAEIRTAHGATEEPQQHALTPDSAATKLSPHDEGRLAEMQVLARQLRTAKGAAREELLDEAQKLAEHLGLTGNARGVETRQKLAFEHLGGGVSEKWLKIATSLAEDNPFRQRVRGNLRADISTLAKRVVLAEQMGDFPLGRESWFKGPVKPAVEDAVEIIRQSLIRDEVVTHKRAGFAARDPEVVDYLRKQMGPADSVERILFDRAFEEAIQPGAHRQAVRDPASLDLSTAAATRATFGEHERFADWPDFKAKYIEKNPSVVEPDPQNPGEVRFKDPLRSRTLFDDWASGSYVSEETGSVRSLLSEEVGPTKGYEAAYAKAPAEMQGLKLAAEIEIGKQGTKMVLDDAAVQRQQLLDDASRLGTTIKKAELLGDEPTAKAAREKLGELLKNARDISEAFGAAAGKAFAAKAYPSATVIEASGSRVFDLVLKIDGEFVIIECKGGTSELGVRNSADGTKRVQQGTREYVMAVADDMANSGYPELEAIGRELFDRLDRDPGYKPKYFVVRQGFDSHGVPTTPTVGEFDMTAKEPPK